MATTFRTYGLAVEFYQAFKNIKLPQHLRDQYLRALSSIALNLKEGSAKPTKDRVKFYFIAMGSFREIEAILDLQSISGVQKVKADMLGSHLYRLCYH